MNGYPYPRQHRQFAAPVVTVIEPPEPYVTLEEAKDNLDVEHSEDDDFLDALIQAATAQIDGPSGWLGRAVGPQTLQLAHYDCSSLYFPLPYPPIISVDAVAYDDADGAEQVVEVGGYHLRRGVFTLNNSINDYRELRIEYRAGYANLGSDSPPSIIPPEVLLVKQAILLQVGDWYANRGDTAPSEGLSRAVKAMLGHLRVHAIA